MVILTGWGGTGTGSTIELARASRQRGAIVVVVAGLPFAEQSFRARMASDALPSLEEAADICIRVSLERLAWQSRRRRLNWQQGSGWIEELVEGLSLPLGNWEKLT